MMPLFERPDFESLLNPALENAKPATDPVIPVNSPTQTRPVRPRREEIVEVAIDVEALTNTIELTRTKLTLAAAVVALLLGIAFAAGYFLASATVPKDKGTSAVTGGKFLEG